MIRAAIIGASGYTGAESIEILLRHSEAELTYLTALPEECGAVQDVFGQFKGRCDLQIEPLDLDKLADLADVALCCLPHNVSMGFVPELFREQIKGADLVANPGCFPTGALLAVAPLLKENLVATDSIIVNAVTGISGAGRNPSSKFHFPNMNENLFAYGIGSHRHMPEMEQIASQIAGCEVRILFQPHAGSFDRGILSTVYSQPKKKVSTEQLLQLYNDFYKVEPFVQICGDCPAVKDVAGTNYCHIFVTCVKGKIVCFSAIDNLVKGASGQAIQNMNIVFGFEETLGLS